MAHGAEHDHGGGGNESRHGGETTRRRFLEMMVGVPLFLFGSMLRQIFNREGIVKFINEASKSLDYFSAPFTKGGGGHGEGGGGGGGHH